MRHRPIPLRIPEIHKAEEFAVFGEADEVAHLVLVDEARARPKSADAICGRRQLHVLDGAGDGLDFFDLGDAAVWVGHHADGDEGRDVFAAGLEFFVLAGRELVARELLVPLGELRADDAHAIADVGRESPGLGHAVGGRPSAVREDFLEDFLVDAPIGELFRRNASAVLDERRRVAEIVSHGEVMLYFRW